MGAAAEIVDVGLGEGAGVQHRHVGVFGRLGAACDGVALPGVVDGVGEAPFAGAGSAVEAPDVGLLVEIDFAAGHGVIAGALEESVEGGLFERVIDAVAGDAAAAVLFAGGEAGAGGGAEGRRGESVGEADAARGEFFEVGGADGAEAGHPIGTPLVGEQQEDVHRPARLREQGRRGEEFAAADHSAIKAQAARRFRVSSTSAAMTPKADQLGDVAAARRSLQASALSPRRAFSIPMPY